METVLSPRLKNVACACLAGLLAAGAVYSKVFLPRGWTAGAIEARLDKNSAGIETLLAGEIGKNLLRSRQLFERYKNGRLTPGDLEKKEALVSARNGVIDFYFGEIYFFKPLALGAGEWRLIKKNQELYFSQLLDGRMHYLHFLMDLRSNPIRRAWK